MSYKFSLAHVVLENQPTLKLTTSMIASMDYFEDRMNDLQKISTILP